MEWTVLIGINLIALTAITSATDSFQQYNGRQQHDEHRSGLTFPYHTSSKEQLTPYLKELDEEHLVDLDELSLRRLKKVVEYFQILTLDEQIDWLVKFISSRSQQKDLLKHLIRPNKEISKRQREKLTEYLGTPKPGISEYLRQALLEVVISEDVEPDKEDSTKREVEQVRFPKGLKNNHPTEPIQEQKAVPEYEPHDDSKQEHSDDPRHRLWKYYEDQYREHKKGLTKQSPTDPYQKLPADHELSPIHKRAAVPREPSLEALPTDRYQEHELNLDSKRKRVRHLSHEHPELPRQQETGEDQLHESLVSSKKKNKLRNLDDAKQLYSDGLSRTLQYPEFPIEEFLQFPEVSYEQLLYDSQYPSYTQPLFTDQSYPPLQYPQNPYYQQYSYWGEPYLFPSERQTVPRYQTFGGQIDPPIQYPWGPYYQPMAPHSQQLQYHSDLRLYGINLGRRFFSDSVSGGPYYNNPRVPDPYSNNPGVPSPFSNSNHPGAHSPYLSNPGRSGPYFNDPGFPGPYSDNLGVPPPFLNNPGPYFNNPSPPDPYSNNPGVPRPFSNNPRVPGPYFNNPGVPGPFFNNPEVPGPYYNNPGGPGPYFDNPVIPGPEFSNPGITSPYYGYPGPYFSNPVDSGPYFNEPEASEQFYGTSGGRSARNSRGQSNKLFQD